MDPPTTLSMSSVIPRVSPPHLPPPAAAAAAAAEAAAAADGASDKKRKRSGTSGDGGDGGGGGDGNSDAASHSGGEEDGHGDSGGDAATSGEIRELLHDKLTSDDAPEVESALDKLANLCKGDGNEGNRQLIGDLGGCQTVLFLMRRAVKSAEEEAGIVVQSLRFLANWVCKEPDNCDTLRRLEGVRAVVDAMAAFPENGYLQRVGCAAFLNFNAAGGGGKAVADMFRAGAIPAIVRAMKAHPDDSHLQRFGCIVLDDVSGAYPPQRGYLLQMGVLGALGGAYEKHARTCPSIRLRGARTMKALIDSVPEE